MDNPWVTGEGSAWWERNRVTLLDPDHAARDHTLMLLERSGLQPARVLEIGCANGWRLDAIRQRIGARCVGIDPSQVAIDDGRERYPLALHLGEAHKLLRWSDERIDLVLMPFVLHWIQRPLLARSIAEADRVLAPGGHLIVTDFLPDVPTKRRYHHRQDVELWTWKADYAAMFTSLGTYREVDRIVFNHDDGAIGDCAPDVRAAAVLLRKEDCYS